MFCGTFELFKRYRSRFYYNVNIITGRLALVDTPTADVLGLVSFVIFLDAEPIRPLGTYIYVVGYIGLSFG